MDKPAVEHIEMVLPGGERLEMERTYIWEDNELEPVGVDPATARAWVDGVPIPVVNALALIEQMKDDAEKRARG